MMKNYSNDVNPVLVKATFKRMAQVDERQSTNEVKKRMANAIRVNTGSRGQMEQQDDDYDVMARGIELDQFEKWAAAVFINCDMSEFIEGVLEMIKTDGSELRRPSAASSSGTSRKRASQQ